MNKNYILIIAIILGVFITAIGMLELISYLEWKEIGSQYFDEVNFQRVMELCKKHNSGLSVGNSIQVVTFYDY